MDIGNVVFGHKLGQSQEQSNIDWQHAINKQHQQVLADLVERVKALEEQVKQLSE